MNGLVDRIRNWTPNWDHWRNLLVNRLVDRFLMNNWDCRRNGLRYGIGRLGNRLRIDWLGYGIGRSSYGIGRLGNRLRIV